MGKKQLKRLIKLYQSDNGALADESIKYKELAERATADCIRLATFLKEYRERTNRAESLIEKIADHVDEWRANPPKNYREETAQDECPECKGAGKIVDHYSVYRDGGNSLAWGKVCESCCGTGKVNGAAQ